MQRSFKSLALMACAVLLAISGLGLMPPPRALAEPAAPTAAAQQIIFLDSAGRVQALNWQQSPPDVKPAWSSATAFPAFAGGWTNLVTGDFNGDGKADIVVTQAGTIRAFFPALNLTSVVNPDLAQTPPAGQQYHLLAAGRFQGLNRDQLAATYRYQDNNQNWHEVLLVFTYQGSTWSSIVVNDFGNRLQSIAAGDLNRDGYADLTVLAFDNKTIEIRAGQPINSPTPLLQAFLYDPPEDAYCCNWWQAAVGNFDKDPNGTDQDHPGNEVVLLRDTGTGAGVKSTLLGWLRPPPASPGDVQTLDTYYSDIFYPNFTSMAIGDITGDGDQEAVQLRDPQSGGIEISTWNPAGVGFPYSPFEVYGYDYGNSAWTQIAAGDINGDGRAEVVVTRSSMFGGPPWMRIFYNPQPNPYTNQYINVGNDPRYPPWPQGLTIADLGLAGFVVSSQNVSFLRQIGSATYPPSVVLTVDGLAVPWQAAVTPNVGWLSVSPLAGSTPQAVTLTINPAAADAMGVGKQSTNITFTPNVPGMQPVNVQVNLHLTTGPVSLQYLPTLPK